MAGGGSCTAYSALAPAAKSMYAFDGLMRIMELDFTCVTIGHARVSLSAC
jgi:hypothetical protein